MAKPEAAATATIASFLQQLATANTANTENTNTNTHEANTNTITNAADSKYSY